MALRNCFPGYPVVPRPLFRAGDNYEVTQALHWVVTEWAKKAAQREQRSAGRHPHGSACRGYPAGRFGWSGRFRLGRNTMRAVLAGARGAVRIRRAAALRAGRSAQSPCRLRPASLVPRWTDHWRMDAAPKGRRSPARFPPLPGFRFGSADAQTLGAISAAAVESLAGRPSWGKLAILESARGPQTATPGQAF